MKPFNFLLVGHVRPFGYPIGVDSSRFQLVAPYETDASKWLSLLWIDRYSGMWIPVSTADVMHALHKTRLQTFRDVIVEFRTHPEAKSLGMDGKPCRRQTVGLLWGRAVQEKYLAYVGKEANKLEEVEARLEQDPEVIYTEHRRPERDEWTTVVLPKLRMQNLSALARGCGVSERTLYSLASGASRPRRTTASKFASTLMSPCRQRD